MTKDEALKLALEALETNNKAWKYLADSGDAGFWEAEEQPFHELSVKAITTIKEALAQPDQEPFGYFQYSIQLDAWVQNRINDKGVAFYTTPPQRTWVGLTEKDICEAAVKSQEGISPRDDTLRFAIAIEAKLKEKNT